MKNVLGILLVSLALTNQASATPKLTCHDEKANVWLIIYFPEGISTEGQGPATVVVGNKQNMYGGHYKTSVITAQTRLKGLTQLSIFADHIASKNTRTTHGIDINLSGQPKLGRFFGHAEITNYTTTDAQYFLSCSSL